MWKKKTQYVYLNAVDRDKMGKVIKIRRKKTFGEEEEMLLSRLSEVKQTPSHPSENNSSSENQRENTSWDNWRIAIQSRIEI